MTKTIRVGLAGCGFTGHVHSRSLILANVSRISKHVTPELVVAADIDIDRAKATADQYGWQHVENTWEKLFKYDLDLIIVALPNGDHVDIVKKAAVSNIALLLEKPVAKTFSEAKEIWAAAKHKSNIRVGYVNRFVPAVQQAKILIESGAIGEIRMFRSAYLLNMRKPGGSPDWRFNEQEAGHGASDDLASHHIDLIAFLTGRITGTRAAARTWHIPGAPPATNDDAINALVTLENDAIGTLSASRTSPGHPLTG